MSPALPPDFAARCGWYDGPGGPLLLSQVPEPYFGEPMILVSTGDRVGRLYPSTTRTCAARTARILDLDALSRSPRYARGGGHVRRRRRASWPGRSSPRRPPARTPRPCFVHGAAGGQRDFNRLFAEPFLDAGVARLIYDKAGHGLSGGSEPTIFDQADAASAAVDLLAAHPDLDVDRIGLAGISNGMWAVPMVAARRPDVAFVVGIGSPGVSMAESEVHRRIKVAARRRRRRGDRRRRGTRLARIFAIAAAGWARLTRRWSELANALEEVAGAADLAAMPRPATRNRTPCSPRSRRCCRPPSWWTCCRASPIPSCPTIPSMTTATSRVRCCCSTAPRTPRSRLSHQLNGSQRP